MAIMALVGLVAGLPAGWLVGRLVKSAGLLSMPWSDEGAMGIAATFVIAGLLVAVLSAFRRGQAILANPSQPEFDAKVQQPQINFFRLQAGVLLLAGAMLGAPIVAGLLARPAGEPAGAPLMAAIVAAFVLQSALNVMLWQRADEVFRQVMAETGAICFWVLQGALFLWACGAKLHVLREISSWDTITVLMGVYLLISTIVGYRRGLG